MLLFSFWALKATFFLDIARGGMLWRNVLGLLQFIATDIVLDDREGLVR